MSRVMLFAGLNECISLCEKLSKLDVIIDVYAENLEGNYPEESNIYIHTGEKLTKDYIKAEYDKFEPDVVIDGVHIADVTIHEYIKEVVVSKKYIKLKEVKENLDVAYCKTMDDVITMVNRTRSNVYFTTGIKDIEKFANIVDSRKRVFLDLPKGNSYLRLAAANGVSLSRINDILDYTEEELVGIINDNSIKYIVASDDESLARLKMMYQASKDTNIIMVIVSASDGSLDVDEVVSRVKAIDAVKQVYIIGVGVGNPKNMTIEACEAIDKCEVILGSEELIKGIGIDNKELHYAYSASEIENFVSSHYYNRLAVVTQGDVCLLNGIAEFIKNLKGYEVRIVQGVSSISYLAARLGIDWTNCVAVDSRTDNVLKAVAENKGVFVFTDGDTNDVLNLLKNNGFENVAACVAERLSFDDEKITTGYVYEVANGEYDSLTVMYFENVSYGKASSLVSDDNLIKGSLPMLNKNLRAVLMRDLDLRANEVIYDIGSGCGAMTVEMALLSDKSRIYAIDNDELALDLVERNCNMYTINNVRAITGDAKSVIKDLPKADAVLVEHYYGDTVELIKQIAFENKVRIVVVTSGFDVAYKLIDLMHKNYFEEIELQQITITEGQNFGSGTNLVPAENCFVIKGIGAIEDK